MSKENIRELVKGWTYATWTHEGVTRSGKILRRNQKTLSIEPFGAKPGSYIRVSYGIVHRTEPRPTTQQLQALPGPTKKQQTIEEKKSKIRRWQYASWTESKTGVVKSGWIKRRNPKTVSILPFDAEKDSDYWLVPYRMIHDTEPSPNNPIQPSPKEIPQISKEAEGYVRKLNAHVDLDRSVRNLVMSRIDRLGYYAAAEDKAYIEGMLAMLQFIPSLVPLLEGKTGDSEEYGEDDFEVDDGLDPDYLQASDSESESDDDDDDEMLPMSTMPSKSLPRLRVPPMLKVK